MSTTESVSPLYGTTTLSGTIIIVHVPDPNAPTISQNTTLTLFDSIITVETTSTSTEQSSTTYPQATSTENNAPTYTDVSTDTDTPTVSGWATDTPQPQGACISPAVVGGIGAGTAVACIVIAALVALFLSRLRRQTSHHPQPSVIKPSESGARPNVILAHPSDHLDVLPELIAHRTYIDNMGDLRFGIKGLVDNYFQHKYIQIDNHTELRFQDLAGRSPYGSTWSSAFLDKRLHSHATQLLIARIIFKSIHPSASPDTSLLLPQLLDLYQILEQGPEPGRRKNEWAYHEENLSIWRQISGHFISLGTALNHAQTQVGRIAAELAPLHPTHHEDFRRQLEGLVEEAARLGLDLFRNPWRWDPIWDSLEHDRSRVVYPGLRFSLVSGHEERKVKTVTDPVIINS